MDREYTILVDYREKKPFPLPSFLPICDAEGARHTVRIRHRTVTLPTGDYVLESHPTLATIERKASLQELIGNLQTSRGRYNFLEEMKRMQNFPYRMLFLERDPSTLYARAPRELRSRTPEVMSLLLHVLMEYNVQLFILPSTSASARRAAGEFAALFLIQAVHSCPISLKKPLPSDPSTPPTPSESPPSPPPSVSSTKTQTPQPTLLPTSSRS